MRQGAAMLKEEAIQYFKRKCVILVGKMRQVEEAISPVPKIP
jgi:ribose 5-phosphate isomerase